MKTVEAKLIERTRCQCVYTLENDGSVPWASFIDVCNWRYLDGDERIGWTEQAIPINDTMFYLNLN